MIRVLLVDDSAFMARATKTILEQLGFEVVAMGQDGFAGIELFQQHLPDVTLLDITMPNMDGLECLSKIREVQPDARVVMLSAVHDDEIIAKCFERGATAYLQKPIRKGNADDMARLQSTVENAAQLTG